MKTKLATTTLSLPLLLALGFGPGQALAQDTEIVRLRDELAELNQRLASLESNPEAAGQPAVSLGSGGLRITSPDRNFDIRVGATVQADARFYGSDASGTASDDFLLRRVRPRIRGTFAESFQFDLQPEFAGSSATLLDANINWLLSDQLQIRIGQAKAPVGLERLKSGANLVFIERAYPTSLLPNREVGVTLHGSLVAERLEYAAGVYNGALDGGSNIRATADKRSFAARVFATPFAADSGHALNGLGFGLAVNQGSPDGAPAVYRTFGQQVFYSWLTGVSIGGDVRRYSPQAYYYNGPFGLLLEYAESSTPVYRSAGEVAQRVRLTNDAFNVTASWVVTGEKNSYGAIRPSNPFEYSGAGKGALEIAALFTALNIDDAAFPLFANPAVSARGAKTVGIGANWYLNQNAKASLSYTVTDFSGGPDGPVTSDDEKALFTRLQLAF